MDPINIDAILTFAAHHRMTVYLTDYQSLDVHDHLDQVGQILVEANYQSINYRYDEQTPAADYRYQATHLFTLPVILTLLDCYDYQSCEPFDYVDSDAQRIIQTIRKAALDILPGMSQAPWGLMEEHRHIQRDTPEADWIEWFADDLGAETADANYH